MAQKIDSFDEALVTVSLPIAETDYRVPFHGRCDSSHGLRGEGRAATEFYTTVKTASIISGVPR
jgi:hypothetical protein